jgi:hypothetical protein
MRKLLTATIVSLPILISGINVEVANAAPANWVKVTGNQGYEVFVDTASIKRQGKMVGYRSLYKLPRLLDGARYLENYDAVDCSSQIRYQDTMVARNDRMVVVATTKIDKYKQVVLGTLEGDVFEFVCDR